LNFVAIKSIIVKSRCYRYRPAEWTTNPYNIQQTEKNRMDAIGLHFEF